MKCGSSSLVSFIVSVRHDAGARFLVLRGAKVFAWECGGARMTGACSKRSAGFDKHQPMNSRVCCSPVAESARPTNELFPSTQVLHVLRHVLLDFPPDKESLLCVQWSVLRTYLHQKQSCVSRCCLLDATIRKFGSCVELVYV